MPPQHIDSKSILSDLEANNAFFDELVDMIPAKHYVLGNSGDDLYNTKYNKGQSKESKDNRRARNKVAKNKKFNPELRESTKEEKRRVEQEAYDESDDDNDAMEDIKFQDNHEEEQEENAQNTKKNHKGTHNSNNSSSNDSEANSKRETQMNANQSRIEDLKAKLRKKLNERQLSKAVISTSDTVVSKRAARRAEKKRRVEMAKKKQKSLSNLTNGITKAIQSGIGATKIKVVKDLGGSRINVDTAPQQPKDVTDDLMGIDFGGIAGLKDDMLTKGNYSSFNKSLGNMGKKKSLERLLAEAEAKKERLRQLKESDDVEDKEKAKKMEWGDALKAASGQGTRKTDPTLLKKAMKRKAKKKGRSQEAWKSRLDQAQDKMEDQQNIRNHNVKQRALGGGAGANLSKKRIKDKETDVGGSDKKRPRQGPFAGKGRAGFEGKKQDFINKGSKGKKNSRPQ